MCEGMAEVSSTSSSSLESSMDSPVVRVSSTASWVVFTWVHSRATVPVVVGLIGTEGEREGKGGVSLEEGEERSCRSAKSLMGTEEEVKVFTL